MFAPSPGRLFAETKAVAASADLAKRIDTLQLVPVLHASRAESHAFSQKDAADWQHKAKALLGLR